jgi:hypothetical protein
MARSAADAAGSFTLRNFMQAVQISTIPLRAGDPGPDAERLLNATCISFR